MRLHEHSRLARILLPPSRVAFTLGVHIFVRGEATAAVVAHEMVHVEQARRIGTLRFHALYVLCNLLCGYAGNPFEREAREVGRETLKRFEFKQRFEQLRGKPKLGARRRARLSRRAREYGVGVLLLVLAGDAGAECLQPPLHSQGDSLPVCSESVGPPCRQTCTTDAQLVECDCSDWMEWPQIVGAAHYRIERRATGSSTWVIQGDTRWRNRSAYDDEGTPVPLVHATRWTFYWDVAPATYGTVYEYRVVPMNLSGFPLSIPYVRQYDGASITFGTVKWNPSPVRVG